MSFTGIDSDVAIIGAGPAGLLAGYETNSSQSGLKTELFTRNQIIGFPPHCSGLISYEGLKNLNLNMQDIKRKIGYHIIKRARFVGPTGNSFEIDRGSHAIIVIDRSALDQYIASRMFEIGCNLNRNHRVKQIEYKKGYWILSIKNKGESFSHKTRVLINAEGVHAHLARSIGLPAPNHKWLFPAFQADIERVLDIEADCSELFFSQRYAPGFFGWVIPLSEESARVGVAIGPWINGKTRKYFYYFLNKHPGLKDRFERKKRCVAL